MKKIIILLFFCSFYLFSNGQPISNVNVLNEAQKLWDGEDWVEVAQKLKSNTELDINGGITSTKVLTAQGKTKHDLYQILNYWFAMSFVQANEVISLNDKELGTIMASGYVKDIVYNHGFAKKYYVSIPAVIRCDIKDGRIRVICTISYYDVLIDDYSPFHPEISGKAKREHWGINSYFPFVKKDRHKETSAKSFVMSHVYLNIIMNNIEKCLTDGLVGGDNNDW